MKPKPSIWRIILELITGRFESPRPRHKVHYGRRT